MAMRINRRAEFSWLRLNLPSSAQMRNRLGQALYSEGYRIEQGGKLKRRIDS